MFRMTIKLAAIIVAQCCVATCFAQQAEFTLLPTAELNKSIDFAAVKQLPSNLKPLIGVHDLNLRPQGFAPQPNRFEPSHFARHELQCDTPSSIATILDA